VEAIYAQADDALPKAEARMGRCGPPELWLNPERRLPERAPSRTRYAATANSSRARSLGSDDRFRRLV